jgi:hypothetical protein
VGPTGRHAEKILRQAAQSLRMGEAVAAFHAGPQVHHGKADIWYNEASPPAGTDIPNLAATTNIVTADAVTCYAAPVCLPGQRQAKAFRRCRCQV